MTIDNANRFKCLCARLEQNVAVIGLFGIITNILVFFLATMDQPYLRFPSVFCVVGVIIGGVLVAHKLWRVLNEPVRCMFFVLSITFILPFEYALLLLLNQETLLIHMFAIAVFALHATVITMFWLPPTLMISSLFAFIFLTILAAESTVSAQVLITIYSSALVMFILAVFDYRRRRSEEEHHNEMKLMAAGIAHELTTPVTSMLVAMKGFKKYLPTLLNAYKDSVKRGQLKDTISEEHLSTLSIGPDSVRRAGNEAIMVIDMFLVKIKGTKTMTKEKHSIKALVEDVLANFPMTEEQRKLIVFDENNPFDINASGTAIKHVFNNLLKNALYQIMKEGQGSITISMIQAAKFNAVYFRDTATGIEPEALSRVFDKFFTNKDSGTGVGLSFCQKAMQDLGGSITCDSEEGQYTEFKLEFPKI